MEAKWQQSLRGKLVRIASIWRRLFQQGIPSWAGAKRNFGKITLSLLPQTSTRQLHGIGPLDFFSGGLRRAYSYAFYILYPGSLSYVFLEFSVSSWQIVAVIKHYGTILYVSDVKMCV